MGSCEIVFWKLGVGAKGQSKWIEIDRIKLETSVESITFGFQNSALLVQSQDGLDLVVYEDGLKSAMGTSYHVIQLDRQNLQIIHNEDGKITNCMVAISGRLKSLQISNNYLAVSHGQLLSLHKIVTGPKLRADKVFESKFQGIYTLSDSNLTIAFESLVQIISIKDLQREYYYIPEDDGAIRILESMNDKLFAVFKFLTR